MILNSLHSSTGNTKLESDVFDHFHQILFQIDQHREELKKRIDDIALAMIDEIKKKEAMYLNELKKRFPPFDYSKSLENELNEDKFGMKNNVAFKSSFT